MAETALDGILSMDMGERMVIVPSVEEVGVAMQRFKWPDYVMFSIMLTVCVAIGIYFGIYRTSHSAQEYLMGGRQMKAIPVTLSLIASFVSGISILGIPTETYLYGMQYMYILVGLALMTPILNYIYLPVFYSLKLTSIYEYLERRFNKRVRLFASFLFTLDMVTWLSIVTYVPALAFNQVTGVNVHYVTPVLCTICIFYTALGGLRAVVWTDTVQAATIFGAILLVAIKGTQDIGGWNTVLERNIKSGRIENPNLALNQSQRYNLWSLTIGGCVYLLQIGGVNQCMLQRYMSLSSLKTAHKATWMFSLGLSAIVLVCGYCGILTYATYHQCDPLTTKLAREKDQLLPLLVMQVLGEYPSLPGIFVAGILSASLSSLSTGLNAMSAVVLEDFYPFLFKTPLTEKQCSLVMKLTVIIFGLICVTLVYIIEHLGAVLQVSMSIGSIASGPSLGMFTMGILLPWVNAKGALIGGISSLVFMSWLCFKAQMSMAIGELIYPEKPLSTEGCHYHFVPHKSVANIHSNATEFIDPTGQFIFHHISYLWYTIIGCSISIVVGISTSFIVKEANPHDVDASLLSPLIKRFIKPKKFPNETEDIIYAFQQKNTTTDVPMQSLQHPE